MPIDFGAIGATALSAYQSKGGATDTLQGGDQNYVKEFAQNQFQSLTTTPTAQKPTAQVATEFISKTASSMAAGEQDVAGALNSGFALAGSVAGTAACIATGVGAAIAPLCGVIGGMLGGLLGSYIASLFGPGGPQAGFCGFCNDAFAGSGNNSQAGFRNGACNATAAILGSCETFAQFVDMFGLMVMSDSPNRLLAQRKQAYINGWNSEGSKGMRKEAIYDLIIMGAEHGATGQKGDLLSVPYFAKELGSWYYSFPLFTDMTLYNIARQYPKALAYICFAANGITDGNEVRRWAQAFDFATELTPLLIAQNYGTVVMANGSIPPGIQAYIDAENKKNAIYKGLAAGFGAAALGLGINYFRQN